MYILDGDIVQRGEGKCVCGLPDNSNSADLYERAPMLTPFPFPGVDRIKLHYTGTCGGAVSVVHSRLSPAETTWWAALMRSTQHLLPKRQSIRACRCLVAMYHNHTGYLHHFFFLSLWTRRSRAYLFSRTDMFTLHISTLLIPGLYYITCCVNHICLSSFTEIMIFRLIRER